MGTADTRWNSPVGAEETARLIADLKQRGLLDSTLVIWGAEFGRLPMSQGGDGRDHNPHGFTMWFAGGGVKPGTIVGETDEMGLRRRWHGDQTDAGYGFVQFAQIGRVSPLERPKFVQFAQIPPPSTIDTV
jgi:hypothetical protein